jgi:hypothetical protein
MIPPPFWSGSIQRESSLGPNSGSHHSARFSMAFRARPWKSTEPAIPIVDSALKPPEYLSATWYDCGVEGAETGRAGPRS